MTLVERLRDEAEHVHGGGGLALTAQRLREAADAIEKAEARQHELEEDVLRFTDQLGKAERLAEAVEPVVGSYTPDPDVTNEDEYEIGARHVEDLRLALAAFRGADARTAQRCRVCGQTVEDGYTHLRAKELDPDHAEALSKTSWQSLMTTDPRTARQEAK